MTITKEKALQLLALLNDRETLKKTLAMMKEEYKEYTVICGKLGIIPKTFDNSVSAIRWRILTDNGIESNTMVDVSAWSLMFTIRAGLYKTDDTGAHGSKSEVNERLKDFQSQGKDCIPWSEFSKHSANRKDRRNNGYNIEEKTGVAGADMLRCEVNDFDKAIRNYKRRKELIHFHNEKYGFDILTTWSRFFELLEQYNDKGLQTWFNVNGVKRNPSAKYYIFQMQVIRTSKKKIAYLQKIGDMERGKY